MKSAVTALVPFLAGALAAYFLHSDANDHAGPAASPAMDAIIATARPLESDEHLRSKPELAAQKLAEAANHVERSDALFALAQSNPGSAMDWYGAEERRLLGIQAYGDRLGAALAHLPVDSFLEYYHTLEPQNQKPLLRAYIAEQRDRQKIAQLGEFVADLPYASHKKGAVIAVAKTMAAIDAQAAQRWVDHLDPAGFLYMHAVAGVAESLSRADPRAAFEWGASLSHFGLAATEQALKRWMQLDPQAAFLAAFSSRHEDLGYNANYAFQYAMRYAPRRAVAETLAMPAEAGETLQLEALNNWLAAAPEEALAALDSWGHDFPDSSVDASQLAALAKQGDSPGHPSAKTAGRASRRID